MLSQAHSRTKLLVTSVTSRKSVSVPFRPARLPASDPAKKKEYTFIFHAHGKAGQNNESEQAERSLMSFTSGTKFTLYKYKYANQDKPPKCHLWRIQKVIIFFHFPLFLCVMTDERTLIIPRPSAHPPLCLLSRVIIVHSSRESKINGGHEVSHATDFIENYLIVTYDYLEIFLMCLTIQMLICSLALILYDFHETYVHHYYYLREMLEHQG